MLYLDPLQLELCFAAFLVDLFLLLEFLFTVSSWDIYVCRWYTVRSTHWKVLLVSAKVFCSHLLNDSWKYRLLVTVKPSSGQWKVNLFIALHNYAASQLRTTIPSDPPLKTYEKLFNVTTICKKQVKILRTHKYSGENWFYGWLGTFEKRFACASGWFWKYFSVILNLLNRKAVCNFKML